ncbi:MAG: hypothetical protein ACLP5H_25675 [Desulfomonilaceae bacterium]
MDLIRRDQLPLEQGDSYVCECAGVGSSPRVVFALHDTIVGRRVSKSQAVALVVGPHSDEISASGHFPLEMIDMRGLQVGPGWLVVAPIFVQPRNRIWI